MLVFFSALKLQVQLIRSFFLYPQIALKDAKKYTPHPRANWQHDVKKVALCCNFNSSLAECSWECAHISICSAGTPAAANKRRGGKRTRMHSCTHARRRACSRSHSHRTVNESLSSGEYSLSALSRSSSLRESETDALLTTDFIGHLHWRGKA